MYLYKQKLKNGDMYLAIKEKYYIPEKGTREKTIEKIGRLSELNKKIDDPIAYYTQYAKELTDKRRSERSQVISIDTSETLDVNTDDTRNVGYGIMKALYKDLKLDYFWNWKLRNRKMEFNTDQIYRLLTFSRIMNPGSKRYTLNSKDLFFEPFDGFSLDDIYAALDIIAEQKESLQKWIFKQSQNICQRDLSCSYFDCTNYYFDIGCPDIDEPDENGEVSNPKYRKRGPEKNHRPDPIVEMGLLIDRNGIPVAYDLFPGNESEKVHMRPVIERVKQKYCTGRVIFVADRGLNTSDNIYWINGNNKRENNQRDGYVYGQSVRGADAEFKAWVLGGGYVTEKVSHEDGSDVVFVHKSRIFSKELNVNASTKNTKTKKQSVYVDQKQMVYYSEKYAKKQKKERDIMIARAKDLIAHPKKYDKITSKGSSSYVINIAFDKNTGAIVEGKAMVLDEEKIREEEKYDGYYAIVTSELKMSDLEMRNIYNGLSKIEASFKVTKTNFESRPIYVWLNEHIDAHFATCFLALVLIRLLEVKLGNKYSVDRILNSLKKYNCTKIDSNIWQFTYYDEILDECGKAFNMDLAKKYRTRQEIQRLLKY